MQKKLYILAGLVVLGILLYVPMPPIVSVDGLMDNYKVNEPITFTINIQGCGNDCGSWIISALVKETGQELGRIGYANGDSPIPRLLMNHDFEITGFRSVPSIDNPGNYTIAVLMDNETYVFEKKIFVSDKVD